MKRILAGVVFGVAFVVNLLMVYTISPLAFRQNWLDMIASMGIKPLPGTLDLLATLDYWWAYPATGVFVFAALFVYMKQTLIACLIMLGIMTLWLVYFYGPLVRVQYGF